MKNEEFSCKSNEELSFLKYSEMQLIFCKDTD